MQTSVKKPSDLRLVMLWAIVLLGYLLFVVEWFVIDRIAGKPAGILDSNTKVLPNYDGWVNSFFANSAGSIAGSATNWSITLLRAVGSVLCGIVVLKFGYRYAVMIMMGLMCLCFPFLIIGDPLGGNNQLTLLRPLSKEVMGKLSSLSSQLHEGQLLGPVMAEGKTMLADGQTIDLVQGLDKNLIGTSSSIAGYALFIIFRSTIAIGGTTLVTYSQPLIASLSTQRRKSVLSNANLWGFNSGIVVAFVPFLFQSVQQAGTKYWVFILTALILIGFGILCVFAWFEKQMDPFMPQKQTKEQMQLGNQPSAGDILKRKATWKMIGIYGICLVVLVNPLTGGWWNILQAVSPASSFNVKDGVKTLKPLEGAGGYFAGLPTLAILWVLGYGMGYMVFSPFNKTVYDRKRWLSFMFFMNALMVIVIVLFAATLGVGTAVGFAFVAIATFIGGSFAWSMQSTILILPHEFKEYKRSEVSVLFGYIWGFGYVIYTAFDITNSMFLEAPKLANPGMKGVSILPGAIAGVALFAGLLLAAIAIVVTLPSSYLKNGDELVSEMTKKWKLNQWQFLVASKEKNRYADLLK